MALRNTAVPIAAALVLGVVAAIFATRWMQQRIAVAETTRSGTVPVVVVAAPIGFGDRIKAGDVKTVAWPGSDVPEGAFSDTAAVVGRYSNQKLVPGEPVLRQRVLEHAGGNLLSSLIEPNRRAVTVRVNDVIGVAGFLLPGNRVDVLATRLDNQRRAETRTLLQNLKVLAVDQTTSEAGSDKPVVVRAVTLEMSPEEAEHLVTATEEGSVQLALRNPEDHTLRSAARSEVQPVAAVAVSEPPPPVKIAPRKAAPPPRQTVTVIRQTQTSEAEAQP